MKDPFVILRAELVEAAERAAMPAPRKRWGRLRRPSRPMAIVLVALVITGSAAAAVLSLTRSQPLVGRVPGAITPASVAGYRYTIAVTPVLFAGTAGWQPWIVYNSPGTSGYGRGGSAASHDPHLRRWRPDQCRAWRVRRVRPYQPTGVGRPDWEPDDPHHQFTRAADRRSCRRVLRPRQRTRVLHPRPPGTVAGGTVAGKHPPRMKNIPTLLPLDRSGRVIATQLTIRRRTDGPPLTWMAPDAVTRWWPLPFGTVPYHHPGYHGRTHPGPGVCELAQHGLPALHAQWGHTVAWISPVHDALGEVFLSCIDAAYYLHGWPFDVAVLLDGRQPGQVLGPIPGARPVPGQPEMVDLATGQFPSSLFTRNFGVTAKRVGNAWLVVQGGSGLAQRLQVLNALRISKLDLHHLASRHAPH